MTDDDHVFWVFVTCINVATALALLVVWLQP